MSVVRQEMTFTQVLCLQVSSDPASPGDITSQESEGGSRAKHHIVGTSQTPALTWGRLSFWHSGTHMAKCASHVPS